MGGGGKTSVCSFVFVFVYGLTFMLGGKKKRWLGGLVADRAGG